MDSQVDLYMNKAINLVEERRNRKTTQNHMIGSWKSHRYRYLPIRRWTSCYREITTSVSELHTLLVVSTRTIGS